jgi:hypothetical protein
VTLATTKSRDPQDDGEADLFGITLNAPLRSLTGRTTNLKGPVNVSSLLGTLTLDDVTGGSLNFTGAADVAGTPTLVFDQVSDLAIASPETPLKAITATEWLDADNIGISAPWVGTLTIKGRAGAALQQLAGDFAADLTLTGHDSKGRSLGTLSVAGAILTSDMTLSGAAGAISATSWSGGTLTALSVGTLAVKDSLAHVTVTLSQRRDLAVKALERLTVGRWIDTSTITTVGNIGTVAVGGMKGCTLRAGEVPSGIDSLLRAALDEMTVKGIADQPYSFINSNISAWTMGTISVVHVQTVNTGANPPEFGIKACTIKSYSRDQRRYDCYYGWYPRDEADDYHVSGS